MIQRPDFARLRDEWALRAPIPTESTMQSQYLMDQQRNPHNDNYPNKAPRRSAAEIVSDLVYEFADGVLRRQYGRAYLAWLKEHFEEDRFGRGWHYLEWSRFLEGSEESHMRQGD